MACKRSEQCEHADICQYAKSNAYDILGGSCYRPKKPLTNEEYIRTCSTEELVNLIVCELRNADLHNMRLKYNLFNGNDFDVVRVWLKLSRFHK